MIKNILVILLFFYTLNVTSQSISATFNNPVEAGSNLTLSITYTNTASDDLIYAAVERKDSDGFDATIVQDNSTLNPVLSTGTDQTGTIVLAIPAGTTPSASLATGEYYDLKITLNNKAWNLLAGVDPAPKLTIAAAGSLSVSDVNNAPATIYPNPAVDVVNILSINGASFNGYNVFDITGKTQLSHAASDIHKVDISELSSGVYFLQLDNYNAIKFIKK